MNPNTPEHAPARATRPAPAALPDLPARVRLVEVGPRDGLQNEARALPAAVKVELIERLARSGLTHIEAGAFVSAKWVPQMADSGLVLRAIERNPDVRYSALVPNLRGLEDALEAGVDEVAVFAAATESFSRRNVNCSIEESIERFRPVAARAAEAGVALRGYVSCVLGCPYEGEVRPAAVAEVTARLIELGCYEISLGDTIGTGTPGGVRALIEAVAARAPLARLAGHFHDTYGQALANLLAAAQMGVATFDSSVAGLGGCPYARGATGNVATEDVLYMLHGSGVRTGVDLDSVRATGAFISEALGRPSASRVARALAGRQSAAP